MAMAEPAEATVANNSSSRRWRCLQKLPALRLRIGSRLGRVALSELVGTFILVSLCLSASANCVVSQHRTKTNDDAATLMATLGSGLALAFSVYAAAGVSGGHLNPAVSIGLLAVGRMPVIDFVVYQVAQYVGAFFGAGLVYLFYSPMFDAIDGGNRVPFGANGTAAAFITLPHMRAPLGLALANQVFTAAVFVLAVRAITDRANSAVSTGLQPFLVGLAATCLLQCTLPVSGCTLNPARDFSPRVLAFLVGYGGKILRLTGPRAFWAPVLGPYLGAVIGSWVYEVCYHKQLNHPKVGEAGSSPDANKGRDCNEDEEEGNGECGRLVLMRNLENDKEAGPSDLKDGKKL